MTATSVVQVTERGPIVVVQMTNPPVNAWTDALVGDFERIVEDLNATSKRAVVITGQGRHFSAGGDFHRFQQIRNEDDASAFVTRVQALMDQVAAIPVPVIAAINGTALGGGLELALACDIRVAARDAALGLPETRWGILAGAGGTQRLARLIGPGAAKRLMYTAEPVTGDEALRLGLVEAVADDPLAAALDIAEQVARNSPRAVRHVKRCVDEGLDHDLATGLRIERDLWIELIPSGDLAEGAAAFFGRRQPVYADEPGSAGSNAS